MAYADAAMHETATANEAVANALAIEIGRELSRLLHQLTANKSEVPSRFFVVVGAVHRERFVSLPVHQNKETKTRQIRASQK